MGFIRKVAVIGAVAALAANRDAVKKAVLGFIGGGSDADKTEVETHEVKALASTVPKTKSRAKARIAKPTGKKVRTARPKIRLSVAR